MEHVFTFHSFHYGHTYASLYTEIQQTDTQTDWRVNRLMIFVNSWLPISLDKQPPTLWGGSHCDCNVCVWPGKQLTGQVDAVSPSTWTRWPCVTSDLVLYLQRPSPPVCLVGFVQTDQLHFFHQSLFVSAPFFKAYQVSFNFILCSPAFHPFFLGSLHPNINNQPCTSHQLVGPFSFTLSLLEWIIKSILTDMIDDDPSQQCCGVTSQTGHSSQT